MLLNDTADVGANNEVGGDGEAIITYTLGVDPPPTAPTGQSAATSSTSPVLAVTGLSLAPLLMMGGALVASGAAMLRVSVRNRPRKTVTTRPVMDRTAMREWPYELPREDSTCSKEAESADLSAALGTRGTIPATAAPLVLGTRLCPCGGDW